MYFVYVLRSLKTGALYKGQTKDLEQRFQEHNRGKTKSSKPGIPWKIIYVEEFTTRGEALAREKYFKTAAGRRFLEKKIDCVGSPPD